MAWLRPVPRTVGAATAYVFPAVSVTDAMLDVALFHPMITTFVSPATCAFRYVAETAVTGVWGVATVCCANTGVAGVCGTVVVVVGVLVVVVDVGVLVVVVDVDDGVLVVVVDGHGVLVVVVDAGVLVVVVDVDVLVVDVVEDVVVVVGGGFVAARNVASCMTQGDENELGAVAL